MDGLVEIGCVACWIEIRDHVACEVHHVLEGGKRMGHRYTVGLCPWHHRGIPHEGLTAESTSLALNLRSFRVRYGDDLHLVWTRGRTARGAE